MSGLSRFALALVIIGALNWGLIGFFQFDLVASLFGGQDAFLSRVVYGLVGLSALVCLGLLFKRDEETDTVSERRRVGNPNLGTEFGQEPDFEKKRDAESKKKNRRM
ncbi:DUF378 domain-containing protein [Sporosarcina pasteurii]|uniref:Domain of uncharacterized function (DUF378) n=1 Tax=Sporosarcina pasteurii TaxID=1474 RepID=A0A380CMG0_SPOPA|nr:DUF378 domain-containing protein [Sporosarcina pasteurii]MDS9471866.1 DUF378 domain-containing protein [Sporosarcina pasteurii]QBQ06605.1 DUF378 domain-containing protein [Sporosarcina pasteurii]SUJ21998.1 Domain of uncharacterised function (DUF378) [Sporosarcina pasteurii]